MTSRRSERYALLFLLPLLVSGDCLYAATVNWTGGDLTWSEPDSNSFNTEYNAGDDVIISSPAGTVSIIGAGISPASVTVNNSANFTFQGGSIGGTGALTKAGSGWLTLNAGNAYTGGTFLIGGWLEATSDTPLGNSPGIITFNGGGWRGLSGASNTKDLLILSGGGSLLVYGNGNYRTSGRIRGTGPLTIDDRGGAGGRNYTFYSTDNDFTGALFFKNNSSFSFTINSMPDSTNGLSFINGSNGGCTIRWGTGATNAWIMNERQITMARTTATTTTFDNDNTAYGIHIRTNILVTSSQNQTFALDAVAGPVNTISGGIPDGAASSIVSITKNGAGTWSFSGVNTYTGNTTVNAGTLVVSGRACLPDEGLLNIVSGKLQLDDREKVGALMTNGVTAASGIWGSSSSGASNVSDTYFSGDGLLYVGVDFPPQGTVIILK